MSLASRKQPRYVVRRLAAGLCPRCGRQPVRTGEKSCAPCKARERERWRRRWQAYREAHPKVIEEITLEMLIHDVRCVAARLGIRRVTLPLYQREGSFAISRRLRQRTQLTWRGLCEAAGLFAPNKGARWLDKRPCRRCGKEKCWNGPGDWYCKVCRRALRRRTTEVTFA